MAIYVPFNEGQQAEEYKARKAAEKHDKETKELVRMGSRNAGKGQRILDDKEYAHSQVDANYDAGKEINKRRKENKDRYPSTKEMMKDPFSDKASKMAVDLYNTADAIDRQNRRHPGNYNPKQNIVDKATKKMSHKTMDKTIDKLKKMSEASIFESVRLI